MVKRHRNPCKCEESVTRKGTTSPTEKGSLTYPFRTRNASRGVLERIQNAADPANYLQMKEKPTPGLEPGTPSLRGKDE